MIILLMYIRKQEVCQTPYIDLKWAFKRSVTLLNKMPVWSKADLYSYFTLHPNGLSNYYAFFIEAGDLKLETGGGALILGISSQKYISS